MSLTLLIKKLYLDEEKIVTADILRKYCQDLKMDYYTAIRYLLKNKYLHRILRGIFYLPTMDERKFGKIDLNYLDALAVALAIKKIKNWYFGLETAVRLNALSHEFTTIDYIINDTIFRPKPILVLGHRIQFVKFKKNLFGFGTVGEKIRYSTPEKTVLDIIYLSRYQGLGNNEIRIKIADHLASCSARKLRAYAQNYTLEIRKLVKEL